MEDEPLEWFRNRGSGIMVVLVIVNTMMTWGLWVAISARASALERKLNVCRAMTPQYEER